MTPSPLDGRLGPGRYSTLCLSLKYPLGLFVTEKLLRKICNRFVQNRISVTNQQIYETIIDVHERNALRSLSAIFRAAACRVKARHQAVRRPTTRCDHTEECEETHVFKSSAHRQRDDLAHQNSVTNGGEAI
jgi:hypothetical protein